VAFYNRLGSPKDHEAAIGCHLTECPLLYRNISTAMTRSSLNRETRALALIKPCGHYLRRMNTRRSVCRL
jgi:hypothetical protein